ncbi:hypothetical protein EAX61_12500 [Dokdonia sinensis]|uniref:Beta-lactamase-inhibitor-like PepSY-like domain-containing protein n=1 Tax=Dokdonia sinensis TaxID=2479847 RepID=A0A3M0FW21_9FLAO|nr:hypothetical protein [Dokdonia sinensis]RMB56881.1 hypothetical protein EAX61_12500 [Dokdonia sinensis]
MKKQLLLFIVFGFAFAKAVTAQTNATIEDVAGIYVDKYSLEEAKFKDGSEHWWKLTLQLDGTFEYHNFRKLPHQDEENFYGGGTWKVSGRTVTFLDVDNDINEKYQINFDGAKARLFMPSPRSKRKVKQKRYIHFFESENSVVESLKLFRADD